MGLIINDKIKKMIVGYPTVSDKYDVAGGTLTGNDGEFGDLVKMTAAGYFEVIDSTHTISAATDVKGIILGTNVKLADYTTGEVKIHAGEAFNLMTRGYMAVEVATTSGLVAGGQVYATAAGAITPASSNNYALANTVFTGEYEQQGNIYVAEIYIK